MWSQNLEGYKHKLDRNQAEFVTTILSVKVRLQRIAAGWRCDPSETDRQTDAQQCTETYVRIGDGDGDGDGEKESNNINGNLKGIKKAG